MCQAQTSLNASYFLLIHQYLVDGLLWPVWECVYTYKKMNVYTKKKQKKTKKKQKKNKKKKIFSGPTYNY